MAEQLSDALLLNIDRIATEGTQARATLSDTVVDEYAEAFKEGSEFPPVEVYFDNTTYWLADGFHRVAAARKAGRRSLIATVYKGGQREALLHALGANETHGLRRTDADRRRAVTLMLNDGPNPTFVSPGAISMQGGSQRSPELSRRWRLLRYVHIRAAISHSSCPTASA